MPQSQKYTINSANSPQLIASFKDAWLLYLRNDPASGSSMSIGGQDTQELVLQPGDTVTFDIGEADLSDGWYIVGGGVGDIYRILTIDKSQGGKVVRG